MDTSANISFVCCIEAGVLEDQTIRMIESFRRHAGKFSKAPIFAVTPRPGPPLSSNTMQALAEFGVTYLREHRKTGYEWFNFLNKPLALAIADKHMSTDAAGWLDGDLLFVAEPSELALSASEDFVAFPVEAKEMGTTGPGDPYETLWIKACEVLDIDLKALPFVTTAQTQQSVRLYFNSGIFVYRRNTAFVQSFLAMCLSMMDAKFITAAPGYNHGFKEMSAVGFSVIKLGLRWRPLSYSHNYLMLSKTHAAWYSEAALADAKVVHYHDAMWPWFWATFCDCLVKTHPQVAAWLVPLGPMSNRANWMVKTWARFLHKLRRSKADNYTQSCTVV